MTGPKKLDEFTPLASVSGNEYIAVQYGGRTYSIQLQQLTALTGSGTSALWASTAFSTNVLLTGIRWMPSQTVSAVVAFTPGAGAAGGSNYVRLIADGTNAPTFVGFTEHGSSAGYDNRANYPNYITFWFDGTTYWYSIQQAAVPAALTDTTPPTFTSAAVANATPTKIVITYSEPLSPTLTGSITVGGSTSKTVSSQTVVGSTVEVVVNAAYLNGDTITVTVPSGCVKDSAGNAATALTAQAVTNNVGAADTTPPVLSTAAIANGTPTVVTLTYNETLNSTAPATSAFTIGGTLGTAKTVSSVSIAGAVVSVTCSSAFVSTDVPTITYTVPGSNQIKDVAGNNAAALTAQAVTNGVTGASYMRFSGLTSMTESGNAGTGWIYTATSTYNTANAYTPSVTLAASTDGSWTGKAGTVGGDPTHLMGLKLTATAGVFSTYDYGIYISATAYKTITSGTAAGTPNGTIVAAATNDLIRMRRTGTSIFAEVSKDSGSTWTVLQTWTSASTAKLYPIFGNDTGLAFGPFTYVGMT